MDTLAGRCDVPPVGPPRDFHPLVVRPAGRTYEKAAEAELAAVRRGDTNLPGIGWPGKDGRIK